jgi:endothelin-converting enzyme/putative endopeptidase
VASSAAVAATAPSTATAQLHGIHPEDIDRTADACTDFFAYANGAWRAANPIPPSMQRWSRRWAAGEQSKDQLRTLLEDLGKRSDWPKGSVDQQITDFYGACMDEGRVDALGAQPVAPLLAKIHAVANAADLGAALADLHEMAIYPLFRLTPKPDNRDPNRVLARVAPAGLGLPDRDYYSKTEPRFVEAREKYRQHVTRMFELVGSTPAAAKKASDAVFALETRLAAARLDNVALRAPAATDHKLTLAALQTSTPSLDWSRYFSRFGLTVGELNVDEPAYMQAMEKEIASTPVEVWKAYLAWTAIDEAAPYLAAPIAGEDFAFNQAYLAGAKEMKPRWKRCVEMDDTFLGEAVGRRYVERYFPPESKARAQEMVKNLLAAMGDTIRGLDWMGAETKKKALEKLATFNPKVGYPDKWKDYTSVAIDRGSLWSNVVAASQFFVRDRLAQIGKPLDRSLWGMTPPTSNAYYDPQLNEIVFPAGILQPPAFDATAADAVNYGAIGVVIGHEISHGFDDEGAQYDAQGRLANWWTAEDLARFQKSTQCVADQFEGYFIEPGIHHQGKLVLGESVADLAGAKLAWLAFQKAQEKNPAPTIDGYTPAQQFFLAWGQWRGDEIRPETQRMMVQGDPHPTGKYRVIGPLSNLPPFAAAFGCKPDAAMVRPPAARCEVW